MRASDAYGFISDTGGTGTDCFFGCLGCYAEGKRLLTIFHCCGILWCRVLTMLQRWLVPYRSTSGGLWCDPR
jgi:hypothetical protein